MRTLDTSPDGAEALERRSSPAWFGRSVRDRAEQNTAPTRPAQPRLQVVLAMGRGVGGCFQTDHLTGHSPPESFARAMASLATGRARAASPVLRARPVACPAGAPRPLPLRFAPERTHHAKNKFHVKPSGRLDRECSARSVFAARWLAVDLRRGAELRQTPCPEPADGPGAERLFAGQGLPGSRPPRPCPATRLGPVVRFLGVSVSLSGKCRGAF